jgi:hypothetical protein
MIPPSYGSFFAGSAQAAAALVGLLFVAVSVAPERIIKTGAPPERQVVAESAFTALVNAFFISMGGLVPAVRLGDVVVGMSLASLLGTFSLAWKLRPSHLVVLPLVRRYALIVVSVVLYGLELWDGLQLQRSPTNHDPLNRLVGLLFAVFALGIARSWELLGSRKGGIFSWLSPLYDVDDDELKMAADGTDEGAARDRGGHPLRDRWAGSNIRLRGAGLCHHDVGAARSLDCGSGGGARCPLTYSRTGRGTGPRCRRYAVRGGVGPGSATIVD